MSFSPQLLDELARVFARAAVDRVFEELAARKPRQESENNGIPADEPSISENASKQANDVDPKIRRANVEPHDKELSPYVNRN